jgi:hypothetical protein
MASGQKGMILKRLKETKLFDVSFGIQNFTIGLEVYPDFFSIVL